MLVYCSVHVALLVIPNFDFDRWKISSSVLSALVPEILSLRQGTMWIVTDLALAFVIFSSLLYIVSAYKVNDISQLPRQLGFCDWMIT